jgi:predicted transcriptional regulator
MNQEQLNIALTAIRMHAAMHPRPSQVTQVQAAEMLGVSAPTVSRMVKFGTLKLNKCGLIPISEIDQALAAKE